MLVATRTTEYSDVMMTTDQEKLSYITGIRRMGAYRRVGGLDQQWEGTWCGLTTILSTRMASPRRMDGRHSLNTGTPTASISGAVVAFTWIPLRTMGTYREHTWRRRSLMMLSQMLELILTAEWSLRLQPSRKVSPVRI